MFNSKFPSPIKPFLDLAIVVVLFVGCTIFLTNTITSDWESEEACLKELNEIVKEKPKQRR